MGILKNRRAAKGITALVIIFSILFGGVSSLSRIRAEAESYYYHHDGKEDGLGLSYDLDQIAANTQNLLTVAGRNLPPNDERTAAIHSAFSEFLAAGSLENRHAALIALNSALDSLAEAFEGVALSSRDGRYAAQCLTNIQSHTALARSAPYNDEARKFNGERAGIPAIFLATFLGVNRLEVFE